MVTSQESYLRGRRVGEGETTDHQSCGEVTSDLYLLVTVWAATSGRHLREGYPQFKVPAGHLVKQNGSNVMEWLS